MSNPVLEAQTTPGPARPPAPRPVTQMVIGCLVVPVILVLIVGAFLGYIWYTATAELIVPAADVLLVRTAPDESAPLLARFGAGQHLPITGRSADWRWLAVEIWDGQQGWAQRPLDLLVWQLRADVATPQAGAPLPVSPPPIAEEMITLAGGAFTMGSPPGLGEADEAPAHTVTLSPFAIDRTEVTVGQYWQCVAAGACDAPTGNASQAAVHYLNAVAFDNHPVIHVPWSAAKAYCEWRGKRLPTEAEWEMAAGWDAGRHAKLNWPWGNEAVASEVNVAGRLPDVAPVGTLTADRSPAGVLDLGGNVREWVLDWYKVDYYRLSDTTNPAGPTSRRGEGVGRVVRGASFADPIASARTAKRGHEDPAYGYNTVGFRCAQTVTP